MLAKRIIPCLDVKDGRVVKGVNFVNIRDAGDPVDNAVYYDEQGADELVFLDITASHEKRNIILHVVEKTADDVFMPLTVGGGVRTLDDIRDLLNAGCDKVSINTAAVKDPYFITRAAEKFGSQCIVLAIDAKRVTGSLIDATGEDWLVDEALKCVCLQPQKDAGFLGTPSASEGGLWALSTHGGRKILLTSMDKDGTKDGYDLELTRAVSEAVSVPVIASGGVGTLDHLYEGIVQGKADAVLAASIFHYREHTVKEAKEFLRAKGIPVRL